MLLRSAPSPASLIKPLSHAGGSAGIGKATAIAFSDNGAIVTITGRRQERLDAVTSQLKKVHLCCWSVSTMCLKGPALTQALP